MKERYNINGSVVLYLFSSNVFILSKIEIGKTCESGRAT
jgi:hypothetical protein